MTSGTSTLLTPVRTADDENAHDLYVACALGGLYANPDISGSPEQLVKAANSIANVAMQARARRLNPTGTIQ